jgi:hypothetical protein
MWVDAKFEAFGMAICTAKITDIIMTTGIRKVTFSDLEQEI